MNRVERRVKNCEKNGIESEPNSLGWNDTEISPTSEGLGKTTVWLLGRDEWHWRRLNKKRGVFTARQSNPRFGNGRVVLNSGCGMGKKRIEGSREVKGTSFGESKRWPSRSSVQSEANCLLHSSKRRTLCS